MDPACDKTLNKDAKEKQSRYSCGRKFNITGRGPRANDDVVNEGNDYYQRRVCQNPSRSMNSIACCINRRSQTDLPVLAD